MANNTIAVDTPFSFVDGEPVGFYLQEQGDSVLITDNADTLAHLASIGWDIGDRRGWRGVKQIISTFGLELHDSGEIFGKEQKTSEQHLITRYLSAMLAVADWEREYLGLPEEINQFVQEVEMYLKAWKPDAPFAFNPSVIGHSGRQHTFHFDFDRKLVEAARPNSGRTGSILRKAADVINSGINRDIMIVMDDREDVERAKVETDILSTMVSVLPFTHLARQLGSVPTQH